jgi:hypothetical protein
MSNKRATKAVSAKKSTTAEFDSNGEDSFDSVLNKQIYQRQLVVIISTTLRVYSCKIEGKYKKLGENNTTLQHARQWSVGILGQQGFGGGKCHSVHGTPLEISKSMRIDIISISCIIR